METAFEYSTAIKNTINSKYSYNISEDKKGYGVLYKHFYREDVIRVKNNIIVDKAISYRFSGVHPIFIEYPKNGHSNFEIYKYNLPKCLISDKDLKTSIVDINGKIENAGTIPNKFIYTIGSYNVQPEYINIYFKVAIPGLYEIASKDVKELILYEVYDNSKLKQIGAFSGVTFDNSAICNTLKQGTTYLAKIKPIGSVRAKIRFQSLTNDFDFLEGIPMYDMGTSALSGTTIKINSQLSKFKTAYKFNSYTLIGYYNTFNFLAYDSNYKVTLYKVTLDNGDIKSATKVYEDNTNTSIQIKNKWADSNFDFILVVSLNSQVSKIHSFYFDGNYDLYRLYSI